MIKFGFFKGDWMHAEIKNIEDIRNTLTYFHHNLKVKTYCTHKINLELL